MVDREEFTEAEAAAELMLQSLEEEIGLSISEELTEDEQTRSQIEQRLAIELRDKVAKNGSIMAYRDECKRDALKGILGFHEVDATDLGKVFALQVAIAKLVSVEKFIQANIAGVGTLVQSGGVGDDADAGDATYAE